MLNDSKQIVAALRSIAELEQASRLDALAASYHAEFGRYPLNVSHWNPSADFIKKLTPILRFSHESDPLSYLFSEVMDNRKDVLLKLGFDPTTKECLITPNGTISMIGAINWAAAAGFTEIAIACPVYFAALHQARILSLRTHKHYMSRRDGRYYLPSDLVDPGRASMPMLITNPVFSTGVSLAEEDVQRLCRHMDAGGVIIADECMAPPGTELGPGLAKHHEGFIGIYSPHKSVSMNGIKFSALVFDRSYLRFFQNWGDVIHGGLSVSASMAVKHYLSDNFDDYCKAFEIETSQALHFVRRTVSEHPGAEIDREISGQLAMIYRPDLPVDYDLDSAFVADMMRNTGGTLISGRRSHFDPTIGASFRVNLTIDSPQFRATLVRILRHMSQPATKAYFSSSRGGDC